MNMPVDSPAMTDASASRPLALAFPLHGTRLIEASAGTGKTYTIATLYLRLVLGHGGEAAFARELLPPQILVVTFTEAATRELRDRIRARLVEAARAFRGEPRPDGQAEDALVAALVADFPAEAHAACARRLDIAAQWMDEAAVSTIHAWCHRMLREHAFASGCLFELALSPDSGELLAEVVRDYWRTHCYPLAGAALAWVARQWQTPDQLQRQLRPLLADDGADADAPPPLAGVLEPVLAERAQALAALKAPWPAWLAELRPLFEEHRAAGRFNGSKLRADSLQRWLDTLDTWARSDAERPDLEAKDSVWRRLTPEGIEGALRKGADTTGTSLGTLLAHPALAAFADLPARLDALADPVEPALRHAAGWVRQRLAAEKRRRAEMDFDDMLARLAAALRGAHGAQLAAVIRAQFPVALIDEFQDTDPLQYGIFDRIYDVAGNAADRGLFLIGDPKQAIYAFRGADIHTYLLARRATAGRHYHLDTNFRSSTDMVAAVNHVFGNAEERPEGAGAFLFRSGAENELPFVPVRARGRADRWQVDGESPAALTFWHLAGDAPIAKGAYVDACAASAATEIVRLLDRGREHRAGFLESGTLRPLRPGDIAVLVRDGSEARAIRGALAARGVRSVYLSDRDSVFANTEAHDLLRWLRACAEPGDDRLLRAALASATLALPLAELDGLNRDERAWEVRVMQFRDYRELWHAQGVLPLLHRLLQDFRLPQRLMGRPEGERVLTNLLHLAELLQQAAASLDGEQALLRHLADLLRGQGEAADEQILRLESDEALVRVVTIHKAKGLEYPLVFLPFLCTFRPVDADHPVMLHDGGRRQLVLRPDADALECARRERLAEDLRLAYVALTRARHACWVGVADLKIGNEKASCLHESALGYLLGGGVPLAASAGLADWLAPFDHPPESQVTPAPEPDHHRWQPDDAGMPAPAWRTPERSPAERWWIASYSALRLADADTAGTRRDDTAPEDAAMENAGDDDSPALAHEPLPVAARGVHRFPRGPAPGTFLHGLLEMAAAQGFGRLAREPEVLRDLVARRCQRRGLAAWVDTLAPWLRALLGEPLALGDGRSASLAGLAHYQPELEFWFPASHVDVRALDRLARRHAPGGSARAPLAPDMLNGLFKGYIDLAFEHEGRYYVLDYKSNWLGPDEAAYTGAAMADAIAAHRYDLQYLLYVLALHRQLALRLPDYDYDRHLGGAIYLFLRAPGPGQFLARPPRALVEALDALFRGTGEAAA